MGWLNTTIVLFALLNIGGGIEGYLSKQSNASLISGVAAGILLLGGVALAASHPRAGYALAAIVAVGDLGFFGMRLVTKGPVLWPAGIMAAVSLAVFVCLAISHFGSRSG